MNTYKLTIATPDGAMFQGDVYALFVRGADGDLAVMARHTPFITSVMAGKCRLHLTDDTEKSATLDGGLLTVSADAVTLLSGSFAWDEA